MDLAPAENLAFHLERQRLLETWQARTLAAAKDTTAAVLLSVLMHSYDDQLITLLHAVFPGFVGVGPPALCSAGRVAKNGTIVADVAYADRIEKQAVLYRSETELRDAFRRLADELKLSDEDRDQLFIAVRKWVVADRRLDPTFDPQDPDAKRLVH